MDDRLRGLSKGSRAAVVFFFSDLALSEPTHYTPF